MTLNFKKSLEDWRRNSKIQRETPEIWLLEDLKVGYIQIPKVATRSIQHCLANYYVEQKRIDKPLSWNKEDIKKVEEKTAFHTTHKTLSALAKDNFIFAFVRNPYDRLYSAYKNKVMQPLEKDKKNIFRNHGIQLGMKFSEFVDIVCNIPDSKIDRHLRSQSWFLSYNKRLIPQFIGHLESFYEDWAELNKQFNLGEPTHKNSTESLDVESYREQYDSELEKKVFNRYKKDFEFFGYERLKKGVNQF